MLTKTAVTSVSLTEVEKLLAKEAARHKDMTLNQWLRWCIQQQLNSQDIAMLEQMHPEQRVANGWEN